ncbi:unnamed protein product [Urochloa humidicola]
MLSLSPACLAGPWCVCDSVDTDVRSSFCVADEVASATAQAAGVVHNPCLPQRMAIFVEDARPSTSGGAPTPALAPGTTAQALDTPPPPCPGTAGYPSRRSILRL